MGSVAGIVMLIVAAIYLAGQTAFIGDHLIKGRCDSTIELTEMALIGVGTVATLIFVVMLIGQSLTLPSGGV